VSTVDFDDMTKYFRKAACHATKRYLIEMGTGTLLNVDRHGFTSRAGLLLPLCNYVHTGMVFEYGIGPCWAFS
jgi:hypothetical protein